MNTNGWPKGMALGIACLMPVAAGQQPMSEPAAPWSAVTRHRLESREPWRRGESRDLSTAHSSIGAGSASFAGKGGDESPHSKVACGAPAEPERWRGYVDDGGVIDEPSTPHVFLGTTAIVPPEPVFDPVASWSVDFESGVLWRVTSNTFLDYTVLPQIISLRTPAHLRFDLGKAGEVSLRSRFSLLLEPIVVGPEHFYLGFSGSPSIEWWAPSKRFCGYFSIGGGIGAIDSQGVAGGQGQDFTYNWFMALGLRFYIKEDFAISVGGMFQHWSDRGATDPNPGLDQLGPTLGLTWHF
jgi:lipid A 3-O-deacylase